MVALVVAMIVPFSELALVGEVLLMYFVPFSVCLILSSAFAPICFPRCLEMVDAALTAEALLICHNSGPRFMGTFGRSMISLAKIGIVCFRDSVFALLVGGSSLFCAGCLIKREDLSPSTAESTSEYIFGWFVCEMVVALASWTFIWWVR